MAVPSPIVAGNWKMNGLKQSFEQIDAVSSFLSSKAKPDCRVLICPPFTLLHQFSSLISDDLAIGAQDCHFNVSGAHTGDISAEMIADTGATFVIVGHSERRADHGESNNLISSKASAAHSAGLIAIICIGETEAERDAGDTLSIVISQLKGSVPDSANAHNTVVAYEPVWAIGTGRTPTTDDVAAVHAAIRSELLNRFGEQGNIVPILYGGSVKPSNADELMNVENVDGALVGGASLKATDFDGIIEAYRK